MQCFVHRKHTVCLLLLPLLLVFVGKGEESQGGQRRTLMAQSPETTSALQAPPAPALAGRSGRLRWDPSPEGLPTIPDLEVGWPPFHVGHTYVRTMTEALGDTGTEEVGIQWAAKGPGKSEPTAGAPKAPIFQDPGAPQEEAGGSWHPASKIHQSCSSGKS